MDRSPPSLRTTLLPAFPSGLQIGYYFDTFLFLLISSFRARFFPFFSEPRSVRIRSYSLRPDERIEAFPPRRRAVEILFLSQSPPRDALDDRCADRVALFSLTSTLFSSPEILDGFPLTSPLKDTSPLTPELATRPGRGRESRYERDRSPLLLLDFTFSPLSLCASRDEEEECILNAKLLMLFPILRDFFF